MGGASYLPSLWLRLREAAALVSRVRAPPPAEWREGDLLIVCDAIEAYRPLFSLRSIVALLDLVASAHEAGVEVILTRWTRVDRSRGDAIDCKAHWSDYVPAEESYLFLPADAVPPSGVRVVDVHHTNALAAPEVAAAAEGKRRLVLAGGWAESCVLHTARAATERSGLVPSLVVAEATVGHAPQRLLALCTLQALYADVVSRMAPAP